MLDHRETLAYIHEMSNELPKDVEVLYEDADCIAVNKPAGLMVHPDGRSEGPFLTDWVKGKYPETMNVGEPIKLTSGEVLHRPGIVHRLDRDTTGVLVIARNAAAHAFLKEQFQGRTIAKKYLTFVWGEIKEEFGTINRPIGRSANDFPRWSAQRGARGEMREAETYWTRLWTGVADVEMVKKDKKGKSVGTEIVSEKFSFIQAEPKTGRTHQIRVHFQSTNHPVVSDEMYAPNRPQALGFTRQALHAWSIEFTTLEGKKVKVTAPLPPDFVAAMKSLDIKPRM